MATIAFDSSDTRDASRLPISLHPAFPAIVALWFAALLGLGSMVLPVVLIERAIDVVGVAALIPGASPPFGFFARGLIALASAVAGAAIGIAIARHVAQAHDGARPSRFAKFASGARRPISVNEELGGEPLINGHGLPVNRRRALAIAEDDRPSDFLYMAPLPGRDQDDHALDLADPAGDHEIDEPLELGDAFADPAEPEESDIAAAFGDVTADEDEPMTLMQEFQPLSPEPDAASAKQEFWAAPEPEPLPFSAPSLARRAALAVPEAEIEAEVALPEPAPLELVPAAEQQEPVSRDWSVAPVDELGLVQLVQRLAASLERRREWLATAPVADSAPMLAPTSGFEPAPAEEAALAMAEFFGKATADATAAPGPHDDEDYAATSVEQPASTVPAARSSFPGSWQIAADDDDLDAAVPSFTLPLRTAVSPTIAFDEPAPLGEDEDREEDDSYSSLLAMRNPFAPKNQGFVRIDEPETDDDGIEPAVVFPGRAASPFAALANAQTAPRQFDPPSGPTARVDAAAQPVSPDTDVALRAALATLQRMSGSA